MNIEPENFSALLHNMWYTNTQQCILWEFIGNAKHRAPSRANKLEYAFLTSSLGNLYEF